MKRYLGNVVYYESFRNDQVLNLYIYDNNEPNKYRKETIKNYDDIRDILPVIDSEMAKIEGISKKGEKVVITYKTSQTTKVDLEYANIDYEKAVGIKDRQQKIESKKKDTEVKKANTRSKAAIFATLALASALLLHSCLSKNKTNVGKDVKDSYKVSDYVPTTKPTVESTPIILTPAPTATPIILTPAPTSIPTVVPTQPQVIEEERKFIEELATPIPVVNKDLENHQRLLNAAIEVSKIDNLGVKNLPLQIFTDPDAVTAALKIINGDFDFNETVVSENNAFKGIVFIHAATSAFNLTNVEDIKLSHYISDPAKANEVRKIENMILTHKNGVNNESDIINEAVKISQTTNFYNKEIDFINASYIASASSNFYKETKDGEFLSKLQNDLMAEINVYCYESNTKTK